MSKFLRILLDAEEPIFTEAVQQLEQLTGKAGADIKLIADITRMAHENMHQMGLNPAVATGPELYNALLARVAQDNVRLGKILGAEDHENIREVVPLMIEMANKARFNRRVFVLKREKGKDLLRQMPPKNLMKRLGYTDIEEMFEKEDFDEIYTALRFSEGGKWLNEYNELFKSVTADDYEERDLRIIQMNHEKYVDLAEDFVKKKLHNVTHTKEMGIIVVVPMRMRKMRGIILKTFPLLFHYMNEVVLYSDFFRLKSTQDNFGKTVVETLIADPGNKSQIVGGKIHWRVIQRYLAKHKSEAVDKVMFEPHVHPEDLHWRRAEEMLYEIDPELKFWKDRDYVGVNYDGFPVAFNLIDVSFAYSNQESYEGRYAYHFRESLWNEIFIRYMGFKNLESQILEQLDNDMIAPEKLVAIPAMDRQERSKVEERLKRSFKLREELIDSAEIRLNNVVNEFEKAFDILSRHEKTVTIFGSARDQSEEVLSGAYNLAADLAREGYAVVTGGSYGVMEAANRGAFEAGGESIGLNIMLPREQAINGYVTDSFEFQHFFGRKVAMTLDASAYIYFPGGFGTLDELFEILVLEQTYKIPRAPIILVGSDFWRPLDSVIRTVLLDRYKTISYEDMDLIRIYDDPKDIIDHIKNYRRRSAR